MLLERAQARTGGGYMLGLMPLVDEPLRRAGVWEEYRDRSMAMHRYRLSSSHGREVRTYSFDAVLCAYGRYGGIERGELIQVMSGGSLPVSFGTSVGYVGQDELGAAVGINTADGLIDARFDLVIAADGMHSATRDLVVDAGDVEEFDTGWGGWVVWADANPTQSDLYAEIWGRGFFIVRYPLRDKVGVFLRGPRTATAVGPAAFGCSARKRLSRVDESNAQAFSAIGAARGPTIGSFLTPVATAGHREGQCSLGTRRPTSFPRQASARPWRWNRQRYWPRSSVVSAQLVSKSR